MTLVLALFLGQSWAAQIRATDFGSTNLSNPIGTVAVILGVKGKVSPCLEVVQQQPQTSVGCITVLPVMEP